MIEDTDPRGGLPPYSPEGRRIDVKKYAEDAIKEVRRLLREKLNELDDEHADTIRAINS